MSLCCLAVPNVSAGVPLLCPSNFVEHSLPPIAFDVCLFHICYLQLKPCHEASGRI